MWFLLELLGCVEKVDLDELRSSASVRTKKLVDRLLAFPESVSPQLHAVVEARRSVNREVFQHALGSLCKCVF